MGVDSESLERIVPDELSPDDPIGSATLALHEERYRFAARHLRAGKVLDLACGVGYGTRLLSDAGAPEVQATGVDLSTAAIDYARQRYGNERTTFERADAMHFAPAERFETIVCLETIEHVADPAGLVRHLASLLAPGGILVGSAPVTPSVDANPYHLHDFTEDTLRTLFLRCGLTEVDAFHQTQPIALGSLLARSEGRLRQVRRGLVDYYLRHPGAFLRRVGATLRYGLANRYLTLAYRRPSGAPP